MGLEEGGGWGWVEGRGTQDKGQRILVALPLTSTGMSLGSSHFD